jgi:hypothetical protein
LIICWGDGQCEKIERTQEATLGARKQNGYTWKHTYASSGNYIVYMTDPNRNGGILNVNFPGSEKVQFHLQTEITISGDFNNTPKLLFW